MQMRDHVSVSLEKGDLDATFFNASLFVELSFERDIIGRDVSQDVPTCLHEISREI